MAREGQGYPCCQHDMMMMMMIRIRLECKISYNCKISKKNNYTENVNINAQRTGFPNHLSITVYRLTCRKYPSIHQKRASANVDVKNSKEDNDNNNTDRETPTYAAHFAVSKVLLHL